jgi:general secretion pathway protein D
METFKPYTSPTCRAALLATACLIAQSLGVESTKSGSLESRHLQAITTAIEEAQQLLKKGDEAYNSSRFSDAVTAYSGARDLIPDSPNSAALRTAATQRFAQASVEQARSLSKKGDIAAAKSVLDKVLDSSVAPNDPAASKLRTELDDAIRTNPALTPEHVENVNSVKKLLITAEGAENLGNYRLAKSTFEEVLRIDPTNTAARRALEKLAAKGGYPSAAYDQTRAEMLSEVEQQWELTVPQAELEISPSGTDPSLNSSNFISVRNKLDRIIIPKFSLDQATFSEALDLLRIKASENDTLELDPARKGVNITANLGSPDSPAAARMKEVRIDLQLTQVPLAQILKYITDISQTTYQTDDFAVTISAAGISSKELVTRNYRVPPDFISNLSNASSPASSQAPDPFGSAPAAAGLIPTRKGAKEALMSQGVTFADGASASYSPSSNTLRVTNTESNQDIISQIVQALTKTEPIVVSVSVTMIRVEKSHLEELGFDWILDNAGFGGDSWVPGAKRLNLTGGTQGNGGDLSDIALPQGSITRNPITAGNRSGDSAILGNNIDPLLTDDTRSQATARAPGVFGIRGALDDTSVQMLMRGLDQKKGTDVMAKPTVSTRSGQASSIHFIREFIYPTEYEPPELPQNTAGIATITIDPQTGQVLNASQPNSNAVTPSTPTAFTKRDVGVTLEVLPVVDADKRFVTLTLSPTFTDFDGFVNYGSPINSIESGPLGQTAVELTKNAILMPVFNTKSFTSSIDVVDGATVVAGSLIQESVQSVEDKTPILGGIPILGRLFQSKAKLPTSTAVIFLVNTQIMDPTGQPYRNR